MICFQLRIFGFERALMYGKVLQKSKHFAGTYKSGPKRFHVCKAKNSNNRPQQMTRCIHSSMSPVDPPIEVVGHSKAWEKPLRHVRQDPIRSCGLLHEGGSCPQPCLCQTLLQVRLLPLSESFFSLLFWWLTNFLLQTISLS